MDKIVPAPFGKWLILRRLCQFGILALFLASPWLGVWLLKGNLASSLVLERLPLTDPFIALQSLAASHDLAATAVLGALIVAGFYLLVGGRAYCAWVCPINPVTDAAAALRRAFGLRATWKLRRQTRYWIAAAVVVASAVTGTIAWEVINPITMLHRGLVFGMGAAWVVVLAIFLFDLFAAKHGWCGHLCPVGAFYGVLGSASLLRVSAVRRDACTHCGDCFHICPEPQVINPALYGGASGVSPVITDRDCINCGRCLDVCGEDVFQFTTRFGAGHAPSSKQKNERANQK